MDKCTFCAGGPDADGSKEEFEKYGAQIYNVRVSKRGYGSGAWGWQTAYRGSIAT